MKDKINSRDDLGETLLFSAVSDGDFKKALSLLKKGADPNVPENNGITPLMEAASSGNLELVKLLLDHQSDPYRLDFSGTNAIDYAVAQGCVEVVELLRLRTDPEKLSVSKAMHAKILEERRLEVERLVDELPETMSVKVWYLYVDGQLKGIEQSEERLQQLREPDSEDEVKVETRQERLGVVKGVSHNWGSESEPLLHVSWQCPACGETHHTDIQEDDLHPALWFCESGYGGAKFLVRWQ
ncbi:MAG: ankyrin repeat domain-containing protein [Planctomycetaceae bacterium]|nr:ankyrin repeat domain-containing protein [Planctomycetaceae bacterium]